MLFRSLWLASIWWEAGYQQGKSDSKSPTCNEIRVNMEQKEIFKEHHLPNCKVNGQWTVSCNYFQTQETRIDLTVRLKHFLSLCNAAKNTVGALFWTAVFESRRFRLLDVMRVSLVQNYPFLGKIHVWLSLLQLSHVKIRGVRGWNGFTTLYNKNVSWLSPVVDLKKNSSAEIHAVNVQFYYYKL